MTLSRKRAPNRLPARTLLGVGLLGCALLLSGCGARSTGPEPGSPGVPPPSAGNASVGAPAPASGNADDVAKVTNQPPPWPCTGWANTAVTAYDRASTRARVFGSVGPGDPVAVVARDARGWLAFSPGTAQAANIGPFRLRWLPPDASLRLEGACSDLPVRVSPPAGVCFEMAMAATPIRSAPDATAGVLATLPANGYVAVTGRGPSGWLRVDAGSGSAPGSGTGWIAPDAVNVNGPCGAYLGSGAGP